MGRPPGVCCPQLRGHAPSNWGTPDRHILLFDDSGWLGLLLHLRGDDSVGSGPGQTGRQASRLVAASAAAARLANELPRALDRRHRLEEEDVLESLPRLPDCCTVAPDDAQPSRVAEGWLRRRRPHALQRVRGPSGPDRHIGVDVAPHDRHRGAMSRRPASSGCVEDVVAHAQPEK